jgi:hypothetical protein
MKHLITFGCSWMFGAGCGYHEDMTREQYKSIVWSEDLANQYSFRSLIAKKYGYEHLNFSIWKSSNQKQFRLAQRFFSSDKFKQLQKNAEEVVVLWGITSTGRDEVFSNNNSQYMNFVIGGEHHPNASEKDASEFFARNIYDHDHCVFELANEMTHWNDYFSLLNIKNYWFDSFNHHDYTVNSPGAKKLADTDPQRVNYLNTAKIDNMVIEHDHSRDLLSQLAIMHGMDTFDRRYHSSAWANDTDRLNFLVDKKILNPYSFHPTVRGHVEIAEFFDPIFNKKVDNKSEGIYTTHIA